LLIEEVFAKATTVKSYFVFGKAYRGFMKFSSETALNLLDYY